MKDNDYKLLHKVIKEVGKDIFPKDTDQVQLKEDELNKLLELYLTTVLKVCNAIFLTDEASK